MVTSRSILGTSIWRLVAIRRFLSHDCRQNIGAKLLGVARFREWSLRCRTFLEEKDKKVINQGIYLFFVVLILLIIFICIFRNIMVVCVLGSFLVINIWFVLMVLKTSSCISVQWARKTILWITKKIYNDLLCKTFII